MTRTPPKPPIVHRLETRRASRPDDRGGLDLMFWGCVAVVVAGVYCLLIWGGVR